MVFIFARMSEAAALSLDALHALAEARWHALPDWTKLRVRRALSWCHRAEEAPDDDARFLFHWIAFNAAYGQEIPREQESGSNDRESEPHRKPPSEKAKYEEFVRRLVDLDATFWRDRMRSEWFKSNYLKIISNRYVDPMFWRCARGEKPWDEEKFQKHIKTLEHGYAHMGTDAQKVSESLLSLLKRLYTLRNQIAHGGATWDSSVNREQVAAAAALMKAISLGVVHTMLAYPEARWERPWYPPVDASGRPIAYHGGYKRPRRLRNRA
ncbi:MAG: hypothetical protein D6771_08580 [Zetaproteobacteria bacterium]|nr:MAG: hypothetical protein D6771_08580 [Zetaproteobacteria bacterium]